MLSIGCPRRLAANVLLGGLHIPVANELVATAVLALTGMTVAGPALLLVYRRADC